MNRKLIQRDLPNLEHGGEVLHIAEMILFCRVCLPLAGQGLGSILLVDVKVLCIART